jgi:hypothetical protein
MIFLKNTYKIVNEVFALKMTGSDHFVIPMYTAFVKLAGNGTFASTRAFRSIQFSTSTQIPQ